MISQLQCRTVTTGSKPILNTIVNTPYSYEELSPNIEFSFNPLVLPFKLKYSPNDGFFIEYTNEYSLVLPIGTFGLNYGLGSVRGVEVNGYRVTRGDYIVGLVDRRKETKQIFVIKGHYRLKAVIEG